VNAASLDEQWHVRRRRTVRHWLPLRARRIHEALGPGAPGHQPVSVRVHSGVRHLFFRGARVADTRLSAAQCRARPAGVRDFGGINGSRWVVPHAARAVHLRRRHVLAVLAARPGAAAAWSHRGVSFSTAHPASALPTSAAWSPPA